MSAVLVTHLSAATASLTWLGWEWLRHSKPSLVGIQVHDEVLNEGLDINIHGERGYDHT